MKRIRLQVQVMPWQKPGSALTSINTRQDAELKWAQPCAENDTIQNLSESILTKWARLCPGVGSLNIRYLTTIHGDLLDMEDTVGAIFDDRTDFPDRLSSNEVLATSIVQVHCYPPSSGELPRFQRLGSLMPDSSARPKKRSLADFQRAPPDNQRTLSSIERPDDVQSDGSFTGTNKRQRTREPYANGYSSSDWRMKQPVAGHAEGNYSSPQMVGTQGFVHQVHDSQEITQKQPNPYGTPTSLSLLSPRELFPRNHDAVQSIPDSPSRREPIDLEALNGTNVVINREYTKSESPEIRLSVHDVPDTHADLHAAQIGDEVEVPVHTSVRPDEVISPPKCVMQEVDSILDIGARQTPSREAHDTENPLTDRQESVKGSHRHSEQIFDEIESDSETFHERQKLHRPKRAKVDGILKQRTSPHHDSHELQKDKHDGPFLVPPIPDRGSRKTIPSGVSEGPQQPQHAASSENYQRKSGGQEVDDENVDSLLPHTHNVQDPPYENDETPKTIAINDEDPISDEFEHRELQSAQAIATSSHVPQKSRKNFKDLDEDHPIKKALGQTRKPKLSTILDLEVQDGARRGRSRAQPRRSQRNAQEGEKQENGEERRDEPTEAQAAPDETVHESKRKGKENGAGNHPWENDEQCKDGGSHSVEQTGPQQLEKAAQETLKRKSGSSTDMTNSMEEALHQQEQPRDDSESNTTPSRLSTGRQSKENALVEQAEKMILEKEGANQLQVEKSQNRQTPKMSQSQRAEPKMSRSTKSKPRTEEQKIARREEEAKQRTEQRAEQSTKAKPVEPKGDPSWAARLFRISGDDIRQSSEHIETDSEKEENPKKQVDTKSSASANSISKHIPNDLGARSSSPSSVSRPGQNRRSLTPAVPNAAAFRSTSSKGSLASSSPLASRSSAASITPLRSVLKHNQPPSTIRRSVSFIDGEENDHSSPKPSNLPPLPSISRPVKSLVDLNNELAFKDASPLGVAGTTSSDVKNREEAMNKPLTKNTKVQQKLNVTRDKKLKDRAREHPSPPKLQPKPGHGGAEFDVFSFPDSSSSSGEDHGNGNAKAGPSSRQKTRITIGSQADFANQLLSRLTPTDPAVKNAKVQGKTASSPLVSRSSSVSKASPRPNSISRSPALAMSETMSSSSDGSSSSEASSESSSSLASNIDPELPIESSRAKSSTSEKDDQPAIADKGDDKKVEARTPNSARRTSQVSQIGSNSTGASNSSDDADPQLRNNESRVAPSQATKSVPSSTLRGHDKSQESDRGQKGRLANSTATPYRYPTLTEQRRMAEGKPLIVKKTAPTNFQRSAIQPTGEVSSSSSDSEDGSSSSGGEGEDRMGASAPSSQTNSQAKSRGFPGLRGVMKLAGIGRR